MFNWSDFVKRFSKKFHIYNIIILGLCIPTTILSIFSENKILDIPLYVNLVLLIVNAVIIVIKALTVKK